MDINQTLESLRVGYKEARFDVSDCLTNPEHQFDSWLEAAIYSKCDEPNAFVLSTAKDNRPRSRVVLLKGIHHNKFIFYTNYKSAKGEEIQGNDRVSMTFLWLPLHRQVRIEGSVTLAGVDVSDEYFIKRPRGSQLGAISSPQSQRVRTREELEDLFQKTEKKFENVQVLPRPAHWGGYVIDADYYEFWQGRNNRMHDRVCYEKENSGWDIFRLAP